MPKDATPDLRHKIDAATYADEVATLAALRATAALTPEDRAAISARAAGLVRDIRGTSKAGLMDVFLAE